MQNKLKQIQKALAREDCVAQIAGAQLAGTPLGNRLVARITAAGPGGVMAQTIAADEPQLRDHIQMQAEQREVEVCNSFKALRELPGVGDAGASYECYYLVADSQKPMVKTPSSSQSDGDSPALPSNVVDGSVEAARLCVGSAPDLELMLASADAQGMIDERSEHTAALEVATCWVADGLDVSFTEDMMIETRDLTSEERVDKIINLK